jgi:hypothetical protein
MAMSPEPLSCARMGRDDRSRAAKVDVRIDAHSVSVPKI